MQLSARENTFLLVADEIRSQANQGRGSGVLFDGQLALHTTRSKLQIAARLIPHNQNPSNQPQESSKFKSLSSSLNFSMRRRARGGWCTRNHRLARSRQQDGLPCRCSERQAYVQQSYARTPERLLLGSKLWNEPWRQSTGNVYCCELIGPAHHHGLSNKPLMAP